MAATNNITRMLDAAKVVYTAFELPADKLGAVDTAEILKVPPSLVYKTIVVNRSKGKPILCVVPGDSEVDLKAVAAVLGEKKVHLPTQAEAEKQTGLQAGGISPLALIHKGFQVLVDESVHTHAEIHISGGQRGLNIRLAPADLVRLTGARVAAVAEAHH